MVDMGGSAAGDLAEQIPGHNQVGVGAADAIFWSLAKRIDPAGSLIAMAAAESKESEAALRLLGGETIPNSLHLVCFGFADHLAGGWVNGKFRKIHFYASSPLTNLERKSRWTVLLNASMG